MHRIRSTFSVCSLLCAHSRLSRTFGSHLPHDRTDRTLIQIYLRPSHCFQAAAMSSNYSLRGPPLLVTGVYLSAERYSSSRTFIVFVILSGATRSHLRSLLTIYDTQTITASAEKQTAGCSCYTAALLYIKSYNRLDGRATAERVKSQIKSSIIHHLSPSIMADPV